MQANALGITGFCGALQITIDWKIVDVPIKTEGKHSSHWAEKQKLKKMRNCLINTRILFASFKRYNGLKK